MLHVSLASLVHNGAFWKGVSLMEAEGGDGCQQGLHGRELWSQRTVLYSVVLGGGAWKHKDLSVLQAYLAFEWTTKKFHLFSWSVDEALLFSFPGLAASICM